MNASPTYQSMRANWLPTSATVLLGLTLILSSCGDGLSGEKYVEEAGKDGIEFKSGDKAYVTIIGRTIEAEYSVDDDKILVKVNGQNMVLDRHEDGTITGLPMSGTLKRKED